jgi:hypothetical protein
MPVMPGDKFLKVDGTDAQLLPISDLRQKLSGPLNSEVLECILTSESLECVLA